MNKYPILAVDNMDMTVGLTDRETEQWYRKAWPNKNGLSFGEEKYDQYGSTQPILRDGVQVGYMWLAH